MDLGEEFEVERKSDGGLFSSRCYLSSGVSRATASGGRASSLRAMMGVGAPGQSSALAPGLVEVASAPAADSAPTLREFSVAASETESGDKNRPLITLPAVVYMICVGRQGAAVVRPLN